MPDYQKYFADFGETTYLNCAYQGVFPLTAVARSHEAVDLKCHPERMDPAEYFGLPERVRSQLAAMGQLARDRGALFVVDGTQGVGALELNVHDLPVDVLAVAAYKWLLGPYGTGFVYIREELLNRLELKVVNWMSVDGSDDFDALPVDEITLADAARVFDVPETANFLNLSAMEASLEFVRGVGARAVAGYCMNLEDHAAEGLLKRGYILANDDRLELPSPLLCFRCQTPEATVKLYEKLKAHHIEVSLRHRRIRISPYLYNTKEDIDRLLAITG